MYRVLAETGEAKERRNQRAPQHHAIELDLLASVIAPEAEPRLRWLYQQFLPAGDHVTAEARFRAGMALAPQQQAKLFELGNAMSLASLLAARGAGDEGRRIVSAVHRWFTEGHDTEDLIAARTLLDSPPSLASPSAPDRKRH